MTRLHGLGWAAIGAVAALVFGSALVVYAATNLVFSGCLDKQGNLYNITISPAQPKACKSGDTPVVWNQTGQPGPQGPAGAAGAPGPQGPAGPSGLVSITYAYGAGDGPQDGNNFKFIGATATVGVAANQVVYVSAQKALGSLAAGGASGLNLSICQRPAGTTGIPAINGLDYLGDLRVPQGTRLPFSLTSRFVGLPAGSYEVGLCGFTAGSAADWNAGEYGRVTAIVATLGSEAAAAMGADQVAPAQQRSAP